MDYNVWNRFLEKSGDIYFAGILWSLCLLYALILAVKYYRNEKFFHIFLIYTISAFFITDIVYTLLKWIFNLQGFKAYFILEIENIVFAEIELMVFLLFFKKTIDKKLTSSIIQLIQYFFSSIFISLLIRILFWRIGASELSRLSYYFNVLEFFLLLPFCLIYFYQLLTKQIKEISFLNRSPSFWIVTGLFFYIIVSLPFLIIGDTLKNNNTNLFFIGGAIHYLSISFLFVCLAKAFSCQTNLTI